MPLKKAFCPWVNLSHPMNLRASCLARTLFLAAGMQLLPAAAPAQTATVATLARLGGDPDGYHPMAPVIAASDGYFYGTTEAGGPGNYGTIYKVASDGTLTTLYKFTGGTDGANPQTALVAGGDGNFYGVTTGTNVASPGTVFRVTPAGALTTVHRFSAFNASRQNGDGGYPKGALLLGGDGNLYGTTSAGGTTGGGTVFRVTLAGALTTLVTFDASSITSAFSPTSALTQGTDGNFYGVMKNFGANSVGSIYRVTPAGALTIIHGFTGGADHGYPTSALTLGADGNFYGVTASNTVYQATPAGAVTTIHTFVTANEGNQSSALIPGPGNTFYGSTINGGAGGFGTAYQITAAGAVTVLYPFTDTNQLGYDPNALLLAGDGNFYGLRQYGGTGSGGYFFRLTPGGALTSLRPFVSGGSASVGRLLQRADGTFFGTTLKGGSTGGGTVFTYTSGAAATTLHSFVDASEGSAPADGLIVDPTGGVFVTTSQGGPMDATNALSSHIVAAGSSGSGGTLEYLGKFDTVGEEVFYLLTLYHFDISFGSSPSGEVEVYIKHNTGQLKAPGDTADSTVFYGITQNGGDNNLGTVYSITADGSHTVLHQFGDQAGDGAGPRSGLVEGSDGNLYGTTAFGGTGNAGTIFSMTPAGILTTLHAFAYTDPGTNPAAALVQGSDGNFYGTTRFTGNGTGYGSVFKITPGGVFTTVHAFDSFGADGGNPMAGLMLASDGNLYGVTSAGGDYSRGTLFSVQPDGTFTTLYMFGANPNDGRAPAAQLIQGSDGNLYGTTEYGGTDDCGTIFQVSLPSLHPAFFAGEAALANGVYYLQFPSGNPFGYYSYLADPHYIFHFDLGYEYVFDAADGHAGVYLYDFASNGFFYTSPAFPFPYLYDFTLNTVLYYYPDPSNAGHYNTDGYRFFYRFDNGQIIVK